MAVNSDTFDNASSFEPLRNNHSNESTTLTTYPGKTIDQYLWIYVSPFILLMGLIGNLLTILVIRQGAMRGKSSQVYLTLMAAADLGFCVVGIIPEWLEINRFITIKEVNQWLCKFDKFFFYIFGDVAIWILVAFTFDRFIAVCFPLKKREVCVPKRAKIACLTIFACALLKNFHVFWTRGIQLDKNGNFSRNCGRPEFYRDFEYYIRPWIAITLVSALPFTLVFVCNVSIIVTLIKLRRKRKSKDTITGTTKTYTQTIAMCLSVSIAFMVLVTPSFILLIGKPYWTREDQQANVSYNLAKAINNQLVYVNHSINFILYCLTGERFRKELVALLCCKPSPYKLSHNSYNSTIRRRMSTLTDSRKTISNVTVASATPLTIFNHLDQNKQLF